MISESEALARILDTLAPGPSRPVPLAAALGLHAAAPLTAPAAVPRFDQSAMDGYALRVADAARPLRVTGEQPAGRDRQLTVNPGEAIRIFTGAPIPTGADCVVMQEDVDRSGDQITIRDLPAPGEFIRPAGADLCAGQSILAPGDLVTPARIGLLASLGIESVHAHDRPRVGIITTGDEVRPLGTPLAPGEIPNSNGPMLAALLTTAGFPADVTTHATDSPEALVTALAATAHCHAVILTGGVSVGEHDHVRATLRDHGADVDLWRVAVKPGKPFLFGPTATTAYFGLPGNPVSTYVTALLFVLPGLRHLAGASAAHARPHFTEFRLASPVDNPGDRPHYLRGTLDGSTFHPAPLQESHALASLANSTALARIPAGATLPTATPVTGLKL